MANDKRPSILSDRGTIGSSAELDEYGVWVKSEPQDLSSVSSDGDDFSGIDDLTLDIPGFEELPDFDDLNLQMSGEASDEPIDFPTLDDFGDDALGGDTLGGDTLDTDTLGVNTLDAETLDTLGDEDFDLSSLDTSTLGASSVEEEESEEGYTEMSLDELLGTMDSPESEPAERPSDLSTQLLMRIADELSSIRAELGSLKSELSIVKGEELPAMETEEGGFFDSQEDETIALTGDELDNILSTADFSEETEAPSMELPDLDEELPEITMDEEMDLTVLTEEPHENLESEDLSLEDSIFEDLTLDEATAEDPIEELVENSHEDIIEDTIEESVEDSIELSDPLDISLDDFSEEELALEDELPIIDLPEEDTTMEALETMEPSENIELSDLSDEVSSLEDLSINLDLEELQIDETPEEDLTVEELSTDELSIEELSMDDLSIDELEIEESSGPLGGLESLELDEEEFDLGGDPSLIPEGFVSEESLVDTPAESEEEILEDLEIIEPTEQEAEEEAEEILVNPVVAPSVTESQADFTAIPAPLKQELKTVLGYMDQLLESLPDDKIEEFARSEHFETYRKLFKELGLV